MIKNAAVPSGTAIIVFPLLSLLPTPVMGKNNRLPIVVIKLGLRGAGDFSQLKSPA
jgi:hypothetical protein